MIPEMQRICDLFMLALTIWREARGETLLTRQGIAQSIQNRVLKHTWFGDSLYAVCTKKWQYSSITAKGDPNLILFPTENDAIWLECLDIAQSILDGTIYRIVLQADSYFDISITAPAWATDDKFVVQIGRVKFYNVDVDHEVKSIKEGGQV